MSIQHTSSSTHQQRGFTLIELLLAMALFALLAVGTAAALGALDGLRKGLVRYKAAALMATIEFRHQRCAMRAWGDGTPLDR